MPLDDFTWGAGTGTAGRATGPPTPLVPGRGGGSAGPGVLSGVDPDLHRAMASAFATVLPAGFRAVMTSGVRSGDPSSQHATGHAEDWHIYDNNRNDISNRGPDVTRLYRNAAVQGLLNLQYINPQKAQQFGWGNYFETEKGSGQRDIMHYDLGGARASPGFGDPQEIYREAAAAKQKFAATPSVAAPTAPATPEQPEQPEQQQAPQWPTAKPWETQQPVPAPAPAPAIATAPATDLGPQTASGGAYSVPPPPGPPPKPGEYAPPQWPTTPPWQQQEKPAELPSAVSPAPPATSQDAAPQWPTSPPWEKPTEAAAPVQDATPQWPTTPPWEKPATAPAETAPAPGTSEKPSPWTPYPTKDGRFAAEPETPVPLPTLPSFASLLPTLPTGQEIGSEASAGTAAPGAEQPTPAPQPEVTPPPPALPVPAELGSEASMGTAAPGAVQPPTPPVFPQVTGVYPVPGELGSEASMGAAAPGATPAAPLAPPQGPYPVPAELGSEASMGTAAPGAVQPQPAAPAQAPYPVPGELGSEASTGTAAPGAEQPDYQPTPSAGNAFAYAATGSLVSSTGQLIGAPGHMITGGAAGLVAGYQAHMRQQIAVMDAIDAGQNPHIDSNDAVMQSFGNDYRDASADQRAAIRQQAQAEITALPPVKETGVFKGAQAVGEAIATPGDWLTTQGEKIKPPPGYEDALSTKVGQMIGTLPAYVIAATTTGLPGLVGVAGMQTYSQAYQENTKAGYAPEDASADAGLKAMAAAGIMTVPMARWMAALTPVEKRVFFVAATRMAADGLFMTSATQAQQFVNNVIDKARLNPDQSLTAGLGDPKEMVASTLFGMLPHGAGLARAGQHDLAVNRFEAQRDAVLNAWRDAVAKRQQQEREAPELPAPAPDAEKVKAGITTVPNTDKGQTLVRATDSLGNSWIGHSGVLVNEGHNPTVDQHFKDAEQTQPVQTNTDLKATKAIDDLVTSTHVDATQGITWTGAYEGEAPKDENGDPVKDQGGNALTGQVMVVGHDAEGHAVEIPEERYAVLGQYGDLNHDTYLMARPGENPLVAVRDPNTGFVYAIAQGHPPATERMPDHLSLEEQDAQGKPGTVEELPQQLLMQARAAGYSGLSKETLAPAEQKMLEDAGIHPDEEGHYPTGQLLEEADRRINDGTWDAKMSQYDNSHLQARVPNTRRQPNIVPPDITDRPSLYRRAYRDMGYDPDVMVNKPVQDQIDVLSAGLKRIYGFKDVVVDPKAQPQKVIDTLLDAHHNLQWMAHALGYSEKGMSLNGELTLRLEPFKGDAKKTYLGLYDPNTKSIHMPDRSNSFAHEWTHALDHALMDKLANSPVARGNLLSSRTREGALQTHVRPGSPEEAFARVMNAIFHDHALEAARVTDLNAKATGTGQAAKAAAAEAARIVAGARTHQGIGPTAFRMGAQSRYHARPEELLARAGEAYVAHLVDVLGAGNEFITKGDRAYLDQATQRFNDLYPHGPDRDAIFKAFQDLHQVLQRDQILGHDPRASVPSDHDILDPIHWRNLAEPQANPALAAGLKKPIVAYTSWRQRMLAGLETTAARMGAERVPRWSRQGILHGALTLKDVVTPYGYSNMGQLGVYHERYENLGNHAAARVISNVMDKLGYRYAEGRLQATPFERLANRLAQSHVNKLDAILRNNGIDTARISAQTDRQLWDALRGRDTGAGPIPANVQRAAGEVRALLNDFWYQVERGGIPVGMPRDEGYVPIAFDHDKIAADGQKAHATISRAMAVDFEVKQRQQNGAFIHEAYGDLNRKNLSQPINDGMTKLGQVQEQMRNETDPQKLADLDRQQQQLLAQLHDPIRDAWAKQRADDWVYALNDVPWGYKNAGGTLPSANPLKNRVLSAEARDIMAENGYILTRPSELLPYYFHQLSRKIAFNQTFGAKGEVLDKVMNDLMAVGVPREDRVEIKRSIESSIGILTSNEVSTGHQFATWARGLYTIGLMGRAAWSTVAEPMVATMQTGSFKAGFHGFTTATRALLADLNLLKPNDRIEHLRDIANVLGVTSTRLSEGMLTGRNAGLLGSPGRLMSNAYRRSGLTYITNANKVGAIASADAALKIWGKQIINQRRGSLFDPHGELRELGIPNSEHADFAKWVTSRDEMPSLDEMTQTPMGQRWAEAVQRFVEKTVIEPIASEKARGANSALGRWIYGLQSYNFGFQRAVLNPFFNRWFTTMAYERGRLGKVQGTLSGTAKWAGYAATSLAGMMAIQLPTTMLRQLLFDTDRTNQWLEDGTYIENIMALAFSRIGLGGVADPLINAISHVRYEHEISSLALGAQANVFAESLQDIIGWATGGGGSAETNISEYRMLRGLYTLIGMPVAATAAAALPGGPRASYLLSLLGQYGTSMTASDQFARSIAGPKGESSKPLTREQQQQRYYHPQPKQKQGSEAGAGSLASGLLGIADDFAVPALRGVGQFLARRL